MAGELVSLTVVSPTVVSSTASVVDIFGRLDVVGGLMVGLEVGFVGFSG